MDPQTSASAAVVAPPVVAEADGWEITSHSTVTGATPPTVEALQSQIADEVAPPADSPEALPPQASEEAPAADESLEAKPEPPKKTAADRKAQLQAEINAAVRERAEQRRALEAEKAELVRLRAERERVAAPPAPPADEPTWEAFEAQGKTWDEYRQADRAWTAQQIKALAAEQAKTIAEQLVEERLQAREQQAVAREIDAAHQARVAAAREKFPDFQQVVEQNLDDIPRTPFLEAAVMRHPHGGELLYHLAQHPAETKALATLDLPVMVMDAVMEMDAPGPLLTYFGQHPEALEDLRRKPPATALVALGRLSAQFDGNSLEGAKNGSPATAPVTRAPAPIRPVGGTRSSGPPRALTDLAFDDYFYAANEAERKRQGRL